MPTTSSVPQTRTTKGGHARVHPEPVASAAPPSSDRKFNYDSLNEGMLKASLTQAWARKDWPAIKKILFGWSANVCLFFIMLSTFFLYGCELFEPDQSGSDSPSPAGNSDELLIAWSFSATQRFLLHEPTLILAAKGLPILFASELCANICGESIVNILTVIFDAIVACAKHVITG